MLVVFGMEMPPELRNIAGKKGLGDKVRIPDAGEREQKRNSLNYPNITLGR